MEGDLNEATAKRLASGIRLEDGPVKPDRIRVGAKARHRSMVTVVLHEGRNRIVRRMFDAVGHPVTSLSRIQIGPVRMGRLRPGELRDVTSEELGALLDAVKL